MIGKTNALNIANTTDIIPSAEYNDVVFYDYDGSILYSYTKEEFLALTEMPKIVSKSTDATPVGWNWSFEDAQNWVRAVAGGMLDIGLEFGSNKNESDNITKIYLNIDSSAVNKTLLLSLIGNAPTTIKYLRTLINWGDSNDWISLDIQNIETFTHTYTAIGEYIITLKVTDVYLWEDIYNNAQVTNSISFGNPDFAYYVDDSNRKVKPLLVYYTSGLTEYYERLIANNLITKLIIGTRIRSFDNYNFNNYFRKGEVLHNCNPNLTIIVKNQNKSYYTNHQGEKYYFGGYLDGDAANNHFVSPTFKADIPSLEQYVGSVSVRIQNKQSICSNNFNTIFINCTDGYTSKLKRACCIMIPFMNTSPNSTLTYVSISPNVTSINGYCNISPYLKYLDFSAFSSIPTLSNYYWVEGYANSRYIYKIIVPDALYNEWKSASNWSLHSSRMIKASEYVKE